MGAHSRCALVRGMGGPSGPRSRADTGVMTNEHLLAMVKT